MCKVDIKTFTGGKLDELSCIKALANQEVAIHVAVKS